MMGSCPVVDAKAALPFTFHAVGVAVGVTVATGEWLPVAVVGAAVRDGVTDAVAVFVGVIDGVAPEEIDADDVLDDDGVTVCVGMTLEYENEVTMWRSYEPPVPPVKPMYA